MSAKIMQQAGGRRGQPGDAQGDASNSMQAFENTGVNSGGTQGTHSKEFLEVRGGDVLLGKSGNGSRCVPPVPRPACFWSIMRALWLGSGCESTLVAALSEWSERQHPQAFTYLCEHATDPHEVRKTLGAIARRMRNSQETEEQGRENSELQNDYVAVTGGQRFAAEIAADPDGWGVIQPYADRQEPPSDRLLDRGWRGIVDAVDAAAVSLADAEPAPEPIKQIESPAVLPAQPAVEQPTPAPEKPRTKYVPEKPPVAVNGLF